MPRGGVREGAGRKKPVVPTKVQALRAFNAALGETAELMRPEEILLRAANNLQSPDGTPWTQAQIDAAKALLPYSIAKPASVAIHHVTRTDTRQFTDAELEHIANRGTGSGGAFATTESPLLITSVVRNGPGPDGADASSASSTADC